MAVVDRVKFTGDVDLVQGLLFSVLHLGSLSFKNSNSFFSLPLFNILGDLSTNRRGIVIWGRPCN